MTKEEWEQKYRYSKNEDEKAVQASSSGDDDASEDEKDDFEYKSKT